MRELSHFVGRHTLAHVVYTKFSPFIVVFNKIRLYQVLYTTRHYQVLSVFGVYKGTRYCDLWLFIVVTLVLALYRGTRYTETLVSDSGISGLQTLVWVFRPLPILVLGTLDTEHQVVVHQTPLDTGVIHWDTSGVVVLVQWYQTKFDTTRH